MNKGLNLKKAIEFGNQITALHKNFSMENYHKAEELFTQMCEVCNNSTDPTNLLGRLVSFSVADGYANYLITKVGKRFVKVMHLPMGDGYRYSGVIDDTLDTRVVQQTVNATYRFRELLTQR